ncbi:hypothetical protein [Curtobacterium flaccumfaciens]|uniref:hypothetical protein n=1 Tax=Curtobacterium flaccumfaciens TaxID=2035 RepID=UPI001BDEA6D5|nr:hypothetical protein [Curtobacterium flaccumfaciens]MBT1674536.1 hypothetical protein [Curtobacterium flaccumfaciens pv. flaccumfaciens]
MDFLGCYWLPAWLDYKWWTDIGTPLIGALAATALGVATLVVAIRGHSLANRIRKEDDDRRVVEARREEQRQRVDFATQARRFAELLRDSKIEDAPLLPPYALENYESELLDTAVTLDNQQDAEHLIERMKGHFSEHLFVPGKRYSGSSLSGIWGAWRQASEDIRAYVQHKPLSEPGWMELGHEDPHKPVVPRRKRPGEE